jgi:hypothetical protein
MLMGFVVVYSSGRRIERVVCENLLACFLGLCLEFCLGRVLYCLLGFLDIYRKFVYRSIRVVEFVGFLFSLGLAHLNRAMDIVLLRMCILVCVLVGNSR